jgi:hypothetical protein
MASAPLPSSRREFLGAAAFALAGLATTARLSAADGSNAPVKRPPNPYVYKFNIGKIEAFSISDGHMLFRQGLELMWPESDRPIMKSALEFNRERLDALPLYVNIMASGSAMRSPSSTPASASAIPIRTSAGWPKGCVSSASNPSRLRRAS